MSSTVDIMFKSSQQAAGGGVVRRSLFDVERLGLLKEIVQRAHEQGFHVIETGGQVVLLCHPGEMVIHC